MHQGDSDNSIVNTRAIWVRCTDREVAPADEDKVGMVDVEVHSFAGNDAYRLKWPLSKPGLDIFGAEHDGSLLEILFRAF